jgi:outer membrane protein assembly factor BamE
MPRSILRPLPALLAVASLAVLSSGCVYRMNIQQGNFLEAKTVDQVTVGMTRSQVRFLLGTPMVAGAFHPDRWDYLYFLEDGKTRKVQQRHFIVWFEDEKVARVDRPTGEIQAPTLPSSPGA